MDNLDEVIKEYQKYLEGKEKTHKINSCKQLCCEEDNLKPVKKYFMVCQKKYIPSIIQKKKKESNEHAPSLLNDKICTNVFERLNDKKFYTGVQKNKFIELLKNNKNKSSYSYNNIKAFSTIKMKPCNYVVTPGTLGIQKYGIQTGRTKTIFLFNNEKKYDKGVYFLVKSYIKNIKSLCYEITKILQPSIGPTRKIYDQNFSLVKNVNDLINGGKYLCTSGDPPAPIRNLSIHFLS
ncbi:putative apicortin [Plasmodium gaboni]|uniref:Putative apicortin n=1 Tax=Plasmodium gaboni TaxID=647221 RepID=A0A151LT66_9APIC|nr:putative apicortin [Plasmodium gaboni]KYO02373.1 putative apicortin [Plasmodium gaboni]